MPGLSAWAVRRPVLALIAWFITVAAIGVLIMMMVTTMLMAMVYQMIQMAYLLIQPNLQIPITME